LGGDIFTLPIPVLAGDTTHLSTRGRTPSRKAPGMGAPLDRCSSYSIAFSKYVTYVERRYSNAIQDRFGWWRHVLKHTPPRRAPGIGFALDRWSSYSITLSKHDIVTLSTSVLASSSDLGLTRRHVHGHHGRGQPFPYFRPFLQDSTHLGTTGRTPPLKAPGIGAPLDRWSS